MINGSVWEQCPSFNWDQYYFFNTLFQFTQCESLIYFRQEGFQNYRLWLPIVPGSLRQNNIY